MQRSSYLRLLLAIVLPALFLTPAPLSAQLSKHGNIWYFGKDGGLDFSSGAPVQLSGITVDTYEGCSIYCDADGQVLFYSNGGGFNQNPITGERDGLIWNKNQAVMYNMGQAEGGGYSAAQGSVILPAPGMPDRYYLFTVDHFPNNGLKGLSYFTIDMTANGGLGAVVNADVNLIAPVSECITAVPMVGVDGFWIISIQHDTRDWVLTPVTASGVGPAQIKPRQSTTQGLVLKASPDGKSLCLNGELYHFDAANGDIDFREQVVCSEYTFSFSPSSRYLYGFENQISENIIRIDLTQDTLSKAIDTVDNTLLLPFTGLMQLGPDGNIYFAEQTALDFFGPELTVSVSMIACPDGLNPVVERRKFVYATDVQNAGGFFTSLPNFADYIFASVPVVDDSLFVNICAGQNVVLGLGLPPGRAYEWSTGARDSTITVNSSGLYELLYLVDCDLVRYRYKVNVDSLETTLLVPPIADSCYPFPLVLRLENISGASVLWYDGSTADTLVMSDFGTVSVTVSNNCDNISLDYSLARPLFVDPQIKTDSLKGCAGAKFVLSALPGAESYEWSTGSQAQEIDAVVPGVYSVVSLKDCIQQEIRFILDSLPTPDFMLVTPAIVDSCAPFPLRLQAQVQNASGSYDIRWSDGSMADSLQVNAFGTYAATLAYGCGEIMDSLLVGPPQEGCCFPNIPNAFSPNGDGVNESFGLITANCDVALLELSVYARWGELMFQSEPGLTRWDGKTLNGTEAVSDVYVYRAVYQIAGMPVQTVKGEVLLLR